MLVLQDTATNAETTFALPEDELRYSVDLPPGEYTAYAYTVGTEVTGAYSWSVNCEANERCETHDLRPFQVEVGQVTEAVDLCDWYEPPAYIASETEAEVVQVTTLQRMDVHAAPSIASPRLGQVPPRSLAQALARTADNAWLQVERPALGSAWIYARLTKVSGPIEDLPVVQATDGASPWAGLAALNRGDTPQFVPDAWSAGDNEAIVHFRGFIKDAPGFPVNGYSVLLYNGTWSVLAHPSGASHHYPDTDEGEWDLVVKNATDAAGWWALTVVSYDCPDFEQGFNAQCKQFTPLSETQVVSVIYPDESVINANWICQENCHYGLYSRAYRQLPNFSREGGADTKPTVNRR